MENMDNVNPLPIMNHISISPPTREYRPIIAYHIEWGVLYINKTRNLLINVMLKSVSAKMSM
jgi:hypothetical protein